MFIVAQFALACFAGSFSLPDPRTTYLEIGRVLRANRDSVSSFSVRAEETTTPLSKPGKVLHYRLADATYWHDGLVQAKVLEERGHLPGGGKSVKKKGRKDSHGKPRNPDENKMDPFNIFYRDRSDIYNISLEPDSATSFFVVFRAKKPSSRIMNYRCLVGASTLHVVMMKGTLSKKPFLVQKFEINLQYRLIEGKYLLPSSFTLKIKSGLLFVRKDYLVQVRYTKHHVTPNRVVVHEQGRSLEVSPGP